MVGLLSDTQVKQNTHHLPTTNIVVIFFFFNVHCVQQNYTMYQ